MLDDENSEVHVFATAPTASGCSYSGAPGTIYEKTASLDNPVFPSGRGTPVIRDAASANVNNVTSTKQSVNSRSGLVVLASNNSTKRYWHADLPLRAGSVVTPAASFTASPSSGTAPLTVKLTDTSTNNPTSWSWNFGNGTTSTTQNPTATYASAGTYTVTMTASNSAGTSPTVQKTITVDAAPTSGGGNILRAGTSTSVATTVATGLTISTPAGTASGDLLVSCLALNGGAVASTGSPAGWTRIAASTGAANPKVYGYYKVAGAAEPADYRWTYSSLVVSSGGIARYTGAAGLDTPAATASGASSTSATVGGVTTATDNAMLVGCIGLNSGSASITITGPTRMSQAWDIAGKRQELDDAVQPTAGTTGSRTWQFSSGREWAGWLAALRSR
ncbi:MAG: PKD domain-containing protein [Nocardioidaceae bacterium]|nr:PKD domain-containing protein [Nocardioidaceae bacterium]